MKSPRQNADPVWLVQNEIYELVDPDDLDVVIDNQAIAMTMTAIQFDIEA